MLIVEPCCKLMIGVIGETFDVDKTWDECSSTSPSVGPIQQRNGQRNDVNQ
jgi:hypothetical protein